MTAPDWPEELKRLRHLVREAYSYTLDNQPVRTYCILQRIDVELTRLETWPGLATKRRKR